MKKDNFTLLKGEGISKHVGNESNTPPDEIETIETHGKVVLDTETKGKREPGWNEDDWEEYPVDQMAVMHDRRKRVGVSCYPYASVPPTSASLKKNMDGVRHILEPYNICFNCHRLFRPNIKTCGYCGTVVSDNKEYREVLLNKELSELEKIPGAYTYEKEIDELRMPLAQMAGSKYPEIITIIDKKDKNIKYDRIVVSASNYLKRLKLISLWLWKDFYEQVTSFGYYYNYRRITENNNLYMLRLPLDLEGYYSFQGYCELINQKVLILSRYEEVPEISNLQDIKKLKMGRSFQVKSRIAISSKNLLYSEFKRAGAALFFKNKDYDIIVPQLPSFIFPKTEEELYELDRTVRELNRIGLERIKQSLKDWDSDELYNNPLFYR